MSNTDHLERIRNLSPEKRALLLKALQADAVSKTIPARSQHSPIPLSFAQQRLWFLEQLQPNSPTYNEPVAFQLMGSPNYEVLRQSFNEILRRHEILRTSFGVIEGEPIQIVSPSLTLNIPILNVKDSATAKREINKEIQRPFDLASSPLLRVTLLRLNPEEHILILVTHHIVSDGWSMGIFIREFVALYKAFLAGQPSPLPELPIQYGDFAVWQRDYLQGTTLQKLLNYWQQQLGSTPPTLQLANPRQGNTQRAELSEFCLPNPFTQQIRDLSQKEGVTLFMTLLAAFQILLQRHTQQTDIVVGTDVANRNRVETEPLIGFFVNLLVLRADLSGNPTFRELLGRDREVTLGAYAHQDLPFAKLVEALRPDRASSQTPLFQVLFVLQNTPLPPLEVPGLKIQPFPVERKLARFDLTLFLAETERGIEGRWHYNADLFDAGAIARFSSNLEHLLSQIVQNPDLPINQLEMSSLKDRKQQISRKKNKLSRLKRDRPKAVAVTTQELVREHFLTSAETLPLVFSPQVDDLDPLDWARKNRASLEQKLSNFGAILFRNFGINSAQEFEALAEAVCPNLFGEYGDLPREGISGKVYGSTPYPADRAILFHNESSHLHSWPQKIFFFCLQPSQAGGETPIIDCQKVWRKLDSTLKEKFEKKQLMYVRNFTKNLDVSWQDFFHTNDRNEVEAYCQKAGIELEWKPDGTLRTTQVRPAVRQHPKTGELSFFNQIQLHHIFCVEPGARKSLLSMFGEENLPRHVYYGDGTPIEDSVVEELLALYRENEVSFPWQKGDVLMLDNMRVAHARNPYKGSRKICVAMGEMMSSRS